MQENKEHAERCLEAVRATREILDKSLFPGNLSERLTLSKRYLEYLEKAILSGLNGEENAS